MRKLRTFLLWAALAAAVALVYTSWDYVLEFWRLLTHVSWPVLGLVLLAQLVYYLATGAFYRAVLAIMGYKVSLRLLVQCALAIAFANLALPSGGASGASFLSLALKDKVPAGRATLAVILRFGFAYVSFLMLLVAGFVMLFLSGIDDRPLIRLGLLFQVVVIVAGVVLLALASDRRRVVAVVWAPLGLINRMFGGKRKSGPFDRGKLEGFVDDLYQGWRLMRGKPRQWAKPLLLSLLVNTMEILSIWLVVLMFGQLVNPGIIIAGYTAANAAAVAGVVTSGLGFYETGMVTGFVALGMPLGLAVSTALFYRVFNLVMFLPPGFYFYRKRI